MTNSPAISIRDVCFSYERREVLHNVSFDIAENDFVAVVGPNGGGKSTLIKLALGLLKPRFGEIEVFGQKPGEACRHIGYVPQHLEFDARFPVSVLDVVLMGRSARHLAGWYRQADKEAARAALDEVGGDAWRGRSFAELSGGERQRVLIAQALASEPRILMLDEPTANVDGATELQIYELLHRLNERLTVIAVSHNLQVVTKHASHVACVNRSAALHRLSEVAEPGQDLAEQVQMIVLHHHTHCQVLDPSHALETPHRASAHTH